ncbi:alpha/beta hydrolase [Enterococcus camelliae]|uniref:Alpha/beta hydrolase n=1 Tax=Enterococcus camelliae TaxID=453959 RepID=A0ABW5TJP9_9ENTE
MSKLATALGEINYTYRKSSNNEPTIVFISGFGGDSTYYNFKSVIDRLPKNYGFLAIDTIGTGESVSTYMERSTKNILANVLDVIDYEQVNKPITVVGHSLGGSYAMILASQNPQKFSSLLLIEPSYSEIREAILAESGQLQSPELIEDAKKNGDLREEDLLQSINPNNTEIEKQKNAEIFFRAYGNAMIYEENKLIGNLLDELKDVEEVLSQTQVRISIIASKKRFDEYNHSKLSLFSQIFAIGEGHYLHWSHPDFIVQKIIDLQ